MKKTVPSLFVILAAVFAISFLAGHAYALDSAYEHLLEGYRALDERAFDKSVKELTAFLEQGRLLRDYALLWRARAYVDLADFKPRQIDSAPGEEDRPVTLALKDLSTISVEFPDSPVSKEARRLEINIESKAHPGRALKLMAQYLSANAGDDAMRFTYAKALRTAKRDFEAYGEFLKIYIGAGPMAEDASKYVETESLEPTLLLQRSKNLMSKFNFEEAEVQLRKTLSSAPPYMKFDINQKIALCLFRQKKYREAARYFHMVGSPYYEARSLYRAGLFSEFHDKVDRLDPNAAEMAAELVLIKGLYYRRKGNVERALKIFGSLSGNRFIKEDATWHVGWTYFLTGSYRQAYGLFKGLHERYDSTKYLYWMARALENDGKDASALYEKLTDQGDYYTFLAYYRLGVSPPRLARPDIRKYADNEELKRLAILLELGIKDAVRTESLYILNHSKNFTSQVNLQASVMLNEAQMYRHSVLLAGKLPYSRTVHGLLYPYAYRDFVDGAAKRFSINPLLVLSIMREESRYQEDAFSHAGAVGLMQLMPKTASKYSSTVGETINGVRDVFNVKKNIIIGSYYLSQLIKESGCVPSALASYNAGEWVVYEWLKEGKYHSIDEFVEDIPYDETNKYVKRVLKTFFQYARASDGGQDNLEFVFDCHL
ncbi:MAG: lytic transglycosylase domain-containing protein [Nitrospirae bacterium]|nr:lytic transglycosylase domain-containing protein [Nitrospirota bacterium]